MGWGGRIVDGKQIQMQAWPIDDRFIDFFGIKITEGRAFRQGEADMNNFILNEKAVQKFGWEKPLEKKFGGLGAMGEVVGVAKKLQLRVAERRNYSYGLLENRRSEIQYPDKNPWRKLYTNSKIC